MFAKEIINRVFVRPLVVGIVALMLTACGSDVEGTYIFTSPKGAVKFAGVLKLKLDSGKAFLTMKQGARKTKEEAGTYVVDGNKVKITDARGKTDIFILGNDGELIPPPGFTAGPKFVRES